MTINIAYYFIDPNLFVEPTVTARVFSDATGKPIISLQFIPNGTEKIIIRQNKTKNDGLWYWQADWLLRLEPDGSLTEYGDDYPNGKLRFVKGHEIRWAENAYGTLWPDLFRSSFSKYGSWGTFLCKAMLQKDTSNLNIYMEQKFKRTDRAVYHCRKGVGITAITYYTDAGDSATITADLPSSPVAQKRTREPDRPRAGRYGTGNPGRG